MKNSNNIFKEITFILFFLLSIVNNAQQIHNLKLNFDFGYGLANPEKLQEILREDEVFLNFSGINVQTQRNFDFDINYGASVLYQINENIAIGINGNYLFSDAYLLYGDANGNYDASGKVKSYSLGVIFNYSQPLFDEINIIGELIPNYNFITSVFKRDIEFFTSPQNVLPYELNSEGNTFSLNTIVGISYSINNFEPFLKVGYRYLFLEKVDLTENDGRDEHNLGEYEFNHDLSGVIFKLGFSYSIEL